MNKLLWVLQAILSLTLVGGGFIKIFMPAALPFAWIQENPNLNIATSVLDILAGLGLILPYLLRIKPQLIIYAAYGTVALMLGAIAFHISRGEAKDIGFNIFVLLASAFIAYGRQRISPVVQ